MENELTYPVRQIDQILRACQADKSLPPGDPRRHDFSKLRGGDVLAEIGNILRSQRDPGTFHHRILCGHRGCGNQKSFTKLDIPIEKISSAGVRRAIEEYRANLTEGLLPKDFERLVAIARRDPEAQGLDDPMLQLLKRRLAFRYSNAKDRWVDVHPMVIETEGFRSAFDNETRCGN